MLVTCPSVDVERTPKVKRKTVDIFLPLGGFFGFWGFFVTG